MRMIGADFWELPQTIAELNGNLIKSTIKPKYSNHLGFYWDLGYKNEPYSVNLTEAQQTYGPGLKGYNNVRSWNDRFFVVEELGGFWCGNHVERCDSMWCSQYPEHCAEKDRLHNFNSVHNDWVMYGWRGAIFSSI
jgi:hypothetical protein